MTRPVITSIAERPELLPVVADWLWRAIWLPHGHGLDEATTLYGACTATVGPPQTLVLLVDGAPIGTATLARHDLEERPELTPWLAGVFVVPEARGRGLLRHLLDAFDARCQAASIGTAWLYTSGAERLYARAGWHATEVVTRASGGAVTLMRRDLAP